MWGVIGSLLWKLVKGAIVAFLLRIVPGLLLRSIWWLVLLLPLALLLAVVGAPLLVVLLVVGLPVLVVVAIGGLLLGLVLMLAALMVAAAVAGWVGSVVLRWWRSRR
ncbi:MAG: hypothetical protein ACRENI_10030 [Gemmatimonadaceae bacterium]